MSAVSITIAIGRIDMNEPNSRIEAARRCGQPAFALGDGVRMIQQAISRIHRKPWPACERRMSRSELQPMRRYARHVFPSKQYWKVIPDSPIFSGGLRFNHADCINGIGANQTMRKCGNRVCCGGILQLSRVLAFRVASILLRRSLEEPRNVPKEWHIPHA